MKALAIALCLVTGTASADCFIRSSIKLASNMITGTVTDVQQTVSPIDRGFQCRVDYRVYIKDAWQSVEGIATAKTAEDACARALDLKSGFVLEEAVRGKMSASTEMICSDREEIHVRPVNRGEQIWESETDLHAVLAERPYFQYKNTQCRLFSERTIIGSNLFTYQGVICRLNSRPDSKWLVIDKY